MLPTAPDTTDGQTPQTKPTAPSTKPTSSASLSGAIEDYKHGGTTQTPQTPQTQLIRQSSLKTFSEKKETTSSNITTYPGHTIIMYHAITSINHTALILPSPTITTPIVMTTSMVPTPSKTSPTTMSKTIISLFTIIPTIQNHLQMLTSKF